MTAFVEIFQTETRINHIYSDCKCDTKQVSFLKHLLLDHTSCVYSFTNVLIFPTELKRNTYVPAHAVPILIAQVKSRKTLILLDFSLTVKAATLIFIYGCGSAIASAKEGKSGSIYNLVKK